MYHKLYYILYYMLCITLYTIMYNYVTCICKLVHCYYLPLYYYTMRLIYIAVT